MRYAHYKTWKTARNTEKRAKEEMFTVESEI